MKCASLFPIMAVPLGLAACASTSHVTAFQEAAIPRAPRTLGLALEPDERLPFGVAIATVTEAAVRAGFEMTAENPRYRLALTAAARTTGAGSYIPPGEAGKSPYWVARPDHSLRARFADGRALRVTAVLIDTSVNREVWRATGTLRTSHPEAAAQALSSEVLAKLPR